MKNRVAAILLMSYCAVGWTQIPNEYYNSATGSGYTLKTQLHNIIDGHSDRGNSAVWGVISDYEADAYYENDNTVLDIYSENPLGVDSYNYTKSSDQCGNYSGEGSCYNREHSFPKSWFDDRSPMFADIHHLYPTDGYVNGQRGNLPFGEVGSASFTSDNGSLKGNARSGLGYSGTVFEPIDEFKGDLARSYFYMATRYEDVLGSWNSEMLDGSDHQVYKTWALEMLLQWHKNDPVSQKEIDRNNNAYTYQGNRNPIVDHPEYIARIWDQLNTTPVITTSTSNIDIGATSSGANSQPRTYTLTGTNLVADVVVSTQAPFELSLNNSSWSPSVTVTQSQAESGLNNTIYVRFSPTSSTGETYSTSISHTSTNAPSVNVTATGTEILSNTGGTSDLLFKQGFEADNDDNWSYTTNPTAGSFSSSTDIWEIVTSLTSITNLPTEGSQFFGARDINNGDNSDGFAELIFTSITTTGTINVQLTFDYQAVGYDATDKIEYEIILNGAGQGFIELFVGASGGRSSSESKTISITDGSTSVGLRIKVTQDGGSDYAGFDNFKLVGETPITIWDGSESANWHDADNWSTENVPISSENVKIAKVSTMPIVSSEASINNLELERGATLTVSSGAALAIFGEAYGDGKVNILRNTTGSGGYSIIGSPISQASILNLNADHVYSYNNGFESYTGAMTTGHGYFVSFEETSPLLTFLGTPNSGDVDIPVSAGFQLVSNPYAAPISIEKFQDANASTIDGTLYFWDDGGMNNGNVRGGDYITINKLGQVSTVDLGANGQGEHAAENGNIASVQGFFVYVTDPTEKVAIRPNMQRTTAESNSDDHFYRKESIPILRLSISNNVLSSETIIGFTNEATEAMDFGLDARYFSNSPLSIYSVSDNVPLAIQALPKEHLASTKIELVMRASTTGTYSLKIACFDKVKNTRIQLINMSDHSKILLNDSEAFNLDLDTGTNRFQIQVVQTEALNISKEDQTTLWSIFPNPVKGNLHIDGPHNVPANFYLSDITGKQVLEISGNVKEAASILSRFFKTCESGLYQLLIAQEKEKQVIKLIKE
jgi:endonuclease I